MKILKWILLLFLLFLVLAVVGGSLYLARLDPNELKPMLTRQVKESTGRDLALQGDLQWSFYPYIGVNIADAQLSNAKGFSSKPFATLDSIDFHVALMPLLKKQVKVNNIVLRGVQLNLEKNSTGTGNWEDLLESKKKDPPKNTKSLTEFAEEYALDIEGLELANARLIFDDQQAGTKLHIEPLNVKTGRLVLPEPISATVNMMLSMDDMVVETDLDGTFTIDPAQNNYHFDAAVKTHLDLKQAEKKIAIALQGQLTAEPVQGLFRLNAAKIDTRLEGDGLPKNGLSIHTRADLQANLKAQTLTIKNHQTSLLDIELTGDATVAQFIDALQYNAKLSSNSFNPKKTLSKLGLTAPQTRDDKALTKAQLTLAITGDKKQLKIKPLKVHIDDSTMTGQLGLTDFSTQAMNFNVNIDQLDADRYRPPVPAEKNTGNTPKNTKDNGVIELPLELLKSLNISGKAAISKLTLNQLQFENISLTVKAKNGEMNLGPVSANAYQGTLSAKATMNVRKKMPEYRTDLKIKGIRSGEVLNILYGDPYVSGMANFSTQLRTHGNQVAMLKEKLNGKFDMRFSDGTIKGSALSQKINEARNFFRKINGKPLITEEITEDTKFSLLTASGGIKNGLIQNNNLSIDAPVFQATGKGDVSLPKSRVNYTLSLAEQGDPKKRTFVPLQIKGPLSDPKFVLRLDTVAKKAAKTQIEDQLKRKEDKIKEQLESELKSKEDQLKKEVEEKLKGLFR